MLKIKYNFDISKVSYIKVGGKVKLYIETDEIETLKKIIKISKKIKYIGNTSNIFFCFDYNKYIFIKYINNKILIGEYLELGSSVSLKYLVPFLIENEISGFEKLGGIPCKIGGAIVNNISCFNQCITTNLVEILVMDDCGKINIIKKEELLFSHHHSSLQNKGILVLYSKFKIIRENRECLISRQKTVDNIRKTKQPYNKLTLGSTFKHYDDINVPLLIENLNLKGKKIDKAQISMVHSNFIEVTSNCNFENIISLIELTNRLLYNKLGYYIDLEIETIRGKK